MIINKKKCATNMNVNSYKLGTAGWIWVYVHDLSPMYGIVAKYENLMLGEYVEVRSFGSKYINGLVKIGLIKSFICI